MMSFDPARFARECEDHARLLVDCHGVTGHERVYATGVLLAGWAGHKSAQVTATRITRAMNMLPWGTSLDAVLELRHGLRKALEILEERPR